MSERTAARRTSARPRWLAWTVAPSLVVASVAVAVLGRVREVEQAAGRYAAAAIDPDRAPEAVEAFESLTWPGLDDEIAPLGRGAASFVAGDLAAARGAFEDALERSSGERRCRAVVNLVLTVEAQGDEVAEIDPGTARSLHRDARDQIDDEPTCRARRDADRMGAGDRLDRAAARLDAKLSGSPPTSSDQRPVSPEQTESEPDQSDLDQLDRALDENAETRSQGPELEGGDTGLPPPRTPEW